MNVSEIKAELAKLDKAMEEKGIRGHSTLLFYSNKEIVSIGLWNSDPCNCGDRLNAVIGLTFEECMDKAEKIISEYSRPNEFARHLTQTIEKGQAAGVDSVHLDLLRDTLDEYK